MPPDSVGKSHDCNKEGIYPVSKNVSDIKEDQKFAFSNQLGTGDGFQKFECIKPRHLDLKIKAYSPPKNPGSKSTRVTQSGIGCIAVKRKADTLDLHSMRDQLNKIIYEKNNHTEDATSLFFTRTAK